MDGQQLFYNPAQLDRQTDESTVYREETRDRVEGDRTTFTAADHGSRVRSGDFATVERIGDENSISARLDSGRAVQLESERPGTSTKATLLKPLDISPQTGLSWPVPHLSPDGKMMAWVSFAAGTETIQTTRKA